MFAPPSSSSTSSSTTASRNVQNSIDDDFSKKNIIETSESNYSRYSSYEYPVILDGLATYSSINTTNKKFNSCGTFYDDHQVGQTEHYIANFDHINRTPSPQNEFFGAGSNSKSKTYSSDSLFSSSVVDQQSANYTFYYGHQKKELLTDKYDHAFEYKYDCYENTSPDTTLDMQTQMNPIERPAFTNTENLLKQQLRESSNIIEVLLQQLNVSIVDNDKKHSVIRSLQNTLKARELDLKEQNKKMLTISQLCGAQQKKINAYESFITSEGYNISELDPTEMATATYPQFEKTSGAYFCSKFPITNDNGALVDHDQSTVFALNSNQLLSQKYCGTALDKKFTEYSRPLDQNTNVNWDSFVDRIIYDTDQQASLFMQQKFKSFPDHRPHIFHAVLTQVHALMINRFGNFLVQKIFELGTPDQIQELGESMKSQILELSCNHFGCHVVQRALERVNESLKFDLVSELRIDIPKTIVHKHACHVWQKIFEIKWTQQHSPSIINHMHESLHGQWSRSIALNETGSLVIQNIFENLDELEKRPIMDDILSNAITVAKGQWGNWVIQHILEHATTTKDDREAVFQFVIKESVQLSMDQFASKVVEKALRLGGQAFQTKFIQHVSSTTTNKRVSLVDIAADQYGNYVVQWLINHVSDNTQRISICRLIKRHMVSLRGSKYGQRVAVLVEKTLRNY